VGRDASPEKGLDRPVHIGHILDFENKPHGFQSVSTIATRPCLISFAPSKFLLPMQIRSRDSAQEEQSSAMSIQLFQATLESHAPLVCGEPQQREPDDALQKAAHRPG
jgi:hypothetical protein